MKRSPSRRGLRLEKLENRALMAADIAHNFLWPHDVNDDRLVSPADALRVINHLNRPREDGVVSDSFDDVNDDSSVTPLDALLVINDLNLMASHQSSPPPGAAIQNPANGVRVRVELETEGSETELDVRMDGAPASQSYTVTLNDIALGEILTDARGRGRLQLHAGDDNGHGSIPPDLLPLRSDMQLVVGDLVHGPLTDLARWEHDSGNSSSNSNGSSTNGSSSNTTSSDDELIASFPIDAGAVRSAEFEQESEEGQTQRKFEAELEHAQPNTDFLVMVANVEVGVLHTDAKGKGKLSLSSRPQDSNSTSMPSNFPAVNEGVTVSIGSIASQFRKSSR